MARSHGTGRACYMGQRPPEGSCGPCRAVTVHYSRKYKGSLKGFMSIVRDVAKRRGSK